MIVDALSDRWGAAETTSRVWFEIAHQRQAGPERTPSGGASTIPWVIGAALICSDESCAETVELVVSEAELSHLVCDGCGCTATVLAVWEVEEARLVGPRRPTSFV